MERAELEQKVRYYREMRRVAEDVAGELERTRQEIREELSARGVEALDVGVYHVSNRLVETSRVDVVALRRECPELVKRYTVSGEARRFLVV